MTPRKYVAALTLALSLAGATMLSTFEDGPHGPSLVSYSDAVGVPTICTGSTKNVFIGKVATPLECSTRLREDTTDAGKAVARVVTVPVTQAQYDSLVSFVFNVGSTNFTRSTLLRKLNKGDYCGAGREFQRWDHAAGKRLRGLTARRRVEAAPFIEECK